ncbi:MAG: heme ABC transporter permease [Proteobacteria bacterium]|nr:heme ABC transporter permease [Pseudomonadota bacterium]
MIKMLVSLGSLRRCYHFLGSIAPWSMLLGLVAIAYGTLQGLFVAPSDYLQGHGFRIIYVHVPCAFFSMAIYIGMSICSMVYLIWRIKLADIIAFSLAPVGAFFTFAALVTGAIWGKPMWGTWWIWDARLTSELILLFLYLGYIGLYNAIGQKRQAAKACAILSLIGIVDIPIIHYSVYWWNTLHQGATISKFSAPSIEKSMLIPLLWMLGGFALYLVALLSVRIRTEILKREQANQWVSALFKKINS